MFKNKPYELYKGDCLEIMDKLIEKGIKVDMILTDLPYGTTKCKWDVVIPFDEMWSKYKKILKTNGVIILFGSEPFSSKLRLSNKDYKYDWIWKKERGTGHLLAKKKPLNDYENICVFYNGKCTYSPQMTQGKAYVCKQGHTGNSYTRLYDNYNQKYGPNDTEKDIVTVSDGLRYPLRVIEFKRDKEKLHPNQKPVSLLEYLIKTYTNENEIVLDNCMGSGSTGVACRNTDRKFIGIELDDTYYEIAEKRISETYKDIL